MKSNIAINNTPERIIIKINFESSQVDIAGELRHRIIKLKKIYRELKKPVNITGKKLTPSEKLEIESIIKEFLDVEVIFEQDEETNYISDFNARRRQTIMEELQRPTEQGESNSSTIEKEFNKIIESKFNATKTDEEEEIEQQEPIIRLELFKSTEEEPKEEPLLERSLGIEEKFAPTKTVIVPVAEQKEEQEPVTIEEKKMEENKETQTKLEIKEKTQIKTVEEPKKVETITKEVSKEVAEEITTSKVIQTKKQKDMPKVENTNSLGLHKIKEAYEENLEESHTKFYKGSLRSGQKLEFEGSIVLIGDVNGGAEIIATGNIAILGILRGVAHAGASGNKKAIIAASQIKAPQIRISNIVKELVEDEENIKQYAYVENNEIIIE